MKIIKIFIISMALLSLCACNSQDQTHGNASSEESAGSTSAVNAEISEPLEQEDAETLPQLGTRENPYQLNDTIDIEFKEYDYENNVAGTESGIMKITPTQFYEGEDIRIFMEEAKFNAYSPDVIDGFIAKSMFCGVKMKINLTDYSSDSVCDIKTAFDLGGVSESFTPVYFDTPIETYSSYNTSIYSGGELTAYGLGEGDKKVNYITIKYLPNTSDGEFEEIWIDCSETAS